VAFGSAEEMRAMAEALDKIKNSLVAGYAAKSGGAEDDIAALMTNETWLDAAEAVELGFADRLAEPVRIAARFDVGRFRNAPQAVVEAMGAREPDDGSENGTAAPAEGEQAAADADMEDVTPAVVVDRAPRPAADPDADPAAPDAEISTIDPAAIRAEALAHATGVVDLCALAGLPLQARRFLETGASLDGLGAR
jgi:hypothetical protein